MSPVGHAQNVTEMTVMMSNMNVSSETLLYNSSLIEAELDALEERLRLLQAQADDDAQLIHDVRRNIICSADFDRRMFLQL